MSYELNINTSVTGQQQVDQLGSAFDKQTERTKRVAEAVQQYITGNSKLSEQQAKLALDEVKLEQLRERHRMSLERLSAATTAGATAADRLAAGNTRVASSSMAASSALRVMEGAMPLRAAANFLGTIQGIGPALQMAFPLFGAVALVEVFGKIATGAQKFIKDLEEGPSRIQQRFRELNATFELSNDELRLSNDRIADTIAKLEHKPRNLLAEALDEARVNADKLAVSLTRDVEKVEELIKKNSVGWGARLAAGREGTGDIEKQFSGYQRVVSDINYAGNAAVHAARTPAEAKKAQGDWDAALAAARTAEQKKIRGWIGQAEAPHVAGAGTIFAQEDHPEFRAARLAVLKGIDVNLMEQGDAATLRTRAAELQGELPIARANAEAERKAAEAARKAEAEAKRQATARLSLTRRTDHWLEQQRIKREEMIDREGVEITKESAKVGGEQLKEAMKEAGFDLARYFPHEIAPLTGMETIPQFSGRMAHQERMMAIGSRPGQEGSLAAQQANARLTAINTIRDRELAILDATRDAAKIADIRNKSDLEAAQVRYEFEEKIAELQRKQRDDFQSSAVGFLNAGRSGGGAGLAQFMRGQLNSMEDKIVSNAAGMAWPTIQKITSGMHIGQAGTALGGLLQGTPFGPDPVKSALEENTRATLANTAAMTGAAPGGGGSAMGMAGLGSPFNLLSKVTGLFRKGGGTAIEGGDLGIPQTSVADMAGGGDYGASASADSGAYGASGGGGLSAGARGVGIAGAALAGAYGMYSGIHSGGARGGLTAAGSAVGSITSILAMALPKAMAVAGPVGMAAGLVLGMIPMLMGDPKQIRQQQISSTLQHSQFMAPVSVNASMGTGGGYSDFDRYGNVRDSSFSPFPTVEQGYFDYRRGVTIAPRTLSQFGGGAPVTVNINAIDSKSFSDHHAEIADAVAKAMDLGSSPSHSEALSRRGA